MSDISTTKCHPSVNLWTKVSLKQ